MADNQQVSKVAMMAGMGAQRVNAQPASAGEDVTYIPGPQDQSLLKWRGIVFKANVPVRVMDPDHIAAARANKFFRVGSGDKATQAADTKPEPTTPETYRAWVVDWLASVDTVDAIATKWSNDRYLRASAQVGESDVRQLGTLIDPKFNQMMRQEGLSDREVAKIMLQHGLTEIPWRV
jgi:hypothetical protein